MVLDLYIGPRRTNRQHSTPNYRPVKSKVEVDYYRQTYCSTETLSRIRRNW